MSIYWSGVLSSDPAKLTELHDALTQRSGKINEQAEKILESRDLMTWTGTAADIAKVDRELLAAQTRHIAQTLLLLASIFSSGSQDLSDLAMRMRHIQQELQAIGITISDKGKPKIPRSLNLSAEQTERIAQAVYDLSNQAKIVDRKHQEAFTNLDEKYLLSLRRQDTLDHLNAMRLNSLEGVSWDYEWRWDESLPVPAERNEGRYIAKMRKNLIWSTTKNGDLPRWLQDYLLNGTAPSPTEMRAFHIFSERSSFYAEQNAEDGTTWWKDGVGNTPKILSPTALSFPSPDAMPQDVAGLIKEMEHTYRDSAKEDFGTIRVSVTMVGDTPHFTAVLPGTTFPLNSSGVAGDPKGTDWAANVHAKGFGTTGVTQSQIAAIETVIRDWESVHGQIDGKPNVMLVGHSQGGMNAANISADSSFASAYNVEYVVTAGAPISDVEVPQHTQVLNFVNDHDPVPVLSGDLGMPWQSQSNYTEVRFSDSPVSRPAVDSNVFQKVKFYHDTETYESRASRALQDNSHPALSELNHGMQNYYPGLHPDGHELYFVECSRR